MVKTIVVPERKKFRGLGPGEESIGTSGAFFSRAMSRTGLLAATPDECRESQKHFLFLTASNESDGNSEQ